MTGEQILEAMRQSAAGIKTCNGLSMKPIKLTPELKKKVASFIKDLVEKRHLEQIDNYEDPQLWEILYEAGYQDVLDSELTVIVDNLIDQIHDLIAKSL